MVSKTALLALLPFFLSAAVAAPAKNCARSTGSGSLNDNCAPGGNFDLSKFSLQLPTGSPGKPTTISGSQLSGCKGYSKAGVFYTDKSDGSMVMQVPAGGPDGGQCVATTNSKHCRTELRETGSWDPTAPTNRLQATLEVPQADSSEHGTVVGQIHIDDSISSKPVMELYCNTKGELMAGVEQTRSGGNEKLTSVGSVSPGSKFSYEIVYEGGKLSVSVNGKSTQLSQYSLGNPKSYFKAGNYNQGTSSSEVKFYALSIQH